MWSVLFPSPSEGNKNVRVFRATRYWESNVCGATVAGLGMCAFFLVLSALGIWMTRRIDWLSVALALTAVGGPIALLKGNLSAQWPYAVEIEEGKGICIYAPFKKIYVPIEEVRKAEWSWLLTGWVIRLRKRHGLLKDFIIHFAWGRSGRELARAIKQELGQA